MNNEPGESNESIAAYQVERREFFKGDLILKLLADSRTLMFEALQNGRNKLLEGEKTMRDLDVKIKEREDFLSEEFKRAQKNE